MMEKEPVVLISVVMLVGLLGVFWLMPELRTEAMILFFIEIARSIVTRQSVYSPHTVKKLIGGKSG